MPWLGYFAKIAQADEFVFLDNVQYSKGGYTNRVQILNTNSAHWMSIAVSTKLTSLIHEIFPLNPKWKESHLDTIKTFYKNSGEFSEIWPRIVDIYSSAPESDLATINRYFVEAIAGELGIKCQFKLASEVSDTSKVSDHRLADLVSTIDPAGVYLSGAMAHEYQSESTFTDIGLELRYTVFRHPIYRQYSSTEFVAGLSVLDSLFNVGWHGTGECIANSIIGGTGT